MWKQAFGVVVVLATMLGGCTAETTDAEMVDLEDEEVAEAEEALASCNAPINAHADWIQSTRNGSSWCIECSYVSIEIRNYATNQVVLSYWAGIDQVTMQYTPYFCFNGYCSGGTWSRTGIRGDFYAPVSVSLQGVVGFQNSAGTTVYVDPLVCSPITNGKTTLTGLGSDGVHYTVTLTNTWFS
jgi:hypothetical protein